MLLSIDPGTRASAYVILDAAERPIEHGKLDNEELLKLIEQHPRDAGRWSAITDHGLGTKNTKSNGTKSELGDAQETRGSVLG